MASLSCYRLTHNQGQGLNYSKYVTHNQITLMITDV